MATKTVVRKYNTKKGQVVKTYTYGDESVKQYKRKTIARQKSIITSNNRIVKKNLNEVVNKIKADTSISKAEKITRINRVKAYAQQRVIEGKGRLTIQGLEAHLEKDAIKRMLDNTNLSVAQVAKDLGVSEADLLSPANLTKDVFTDPKTGKSWKFTFNYTYAGDTAGSFEAII